MERIDFLKKTMAFCGFSLIPMGIIESCTKQNTAAPTNVNLTIDLTAAANSALTTTGGYLITNNIIFIRASASTFYALSAICTHQGCTVGYDASKADIVCPCHGGTYNRDTGAVIAGPPPAALTTYTTSLSGNTLTVKS